MAIYHLEAKMVSRGAGRSAVAASAYLSCSRILNEYDGVQHDYTRKQGLVWQAVFLPDMAPVEWQDREKLWNAVEETEKTKDSAWRGSSSPRCPSSCHASSRLHSCKSLSGSSSWRRGCAPTLPSTTPTATIPMPTSC